MEIKDREQLARTYQIQEELLLQKRVTLSLKKDSHLKRAIEYTNGHIRAHKKQKMVLLVEYPIGDLQENV